MKNITIGEVRKKYPGLYYLFERDKYEEPGSMTTPFRDCVMSCISWVGKNGKWSEIYDATVEEAHKLAGIKMPDFKIGDTLEMVVGGYCYTKSRWSDKKPYDKLPIDNMCRNDVIYGPGKVISIFYSTSSKEYMYLLDTYTNAVSKEGLRHAGSVEAPTPKEDHRPTDEEVLARYPEGTRYRALNNSGKEIGARMSEGRVRRGTNSMWVNRSGFCWVAGQWAEILEEEKPEPKPAITYEDDWGSTISVEMWHILEVIRDRFKEGDEIKFAHIPTTSQTAILAGPLKLEVRGSVVYNKGPMKNTGGWSPCMYYGAEYAVKVEPKTVKLSDASRGIISDPCSWHDAQFRDVDYEQAAAYAAATPHFDHTVASGLALQYGSSGGSSDVKEKKLPEVELIDPKMVTLKKKSKVKSLKYTKDEIHN